jgi:hypothetical protein
MKNLNDHQSRLWGDMLKSISCFRTGQLSYNNLVGNLEGGLDASELKDQRIIEQWYNHWIPLEIERATHGDSVKVSTIESHLKSFEEFIRSALDE